MGQERGGSIDHHCIGGLVTARGAGGGEVKFFDRGPFPFLVGRFALSAIELVDLRVAAEAGLRVRLWGWGLVFQPFETGGRGDRVSAVGVTMALISGIVFMIGAGVGGGGAVGIEEGRGMRFHFHLGMTASEGDLGGIGGIFVHEEIEDIDGLGVLCGNGGRRRWRFGGWFNDCNGILGVGVEGIFHVGFAWYQGGGSRIDFDGFLELL